MKELSIEEKAQRYDSMFERLKEMYNNNKTNVAARLICERYFPELKESEDERVRKEIIDFIYDKTDTYELREKSNSWLAWLEKQGEQKSAWSEEDTFMYNKIRNLLTDISLAPESRNSLFDWLESLRPQPKQRWSEEDALRLEEVICMIEANGRWVRSDDAVKSVLDWLKSLRPQKQWKPSDEQMDALQYVYRNCNPLPSDKLGWDSIKTIELMYQELKKLREE